MMPADRGVDPIFDALHHCNSYLCMIWQFPEKTCSTAMQGNQDAAAIMFINCPDENC